MNQPPPLPPGSRRPATHTYESVFGQLYRKLLQKRPGYSWARLATTLESGYKHFASQFETEAEICFEAEAALWEHHFADAPFPGRLVPIVQANPQQQGPVNTGVNTGVTSSVPNAGTPAIFPATPAVTSIVNSNSPAVAVGPHPFPRRPDSQAIRTPATHVSVSVFGHMVQRLENERGYPATRAYNTLNTLFEQTPPEFPTEEEARYEAEKLLWEHYFADPFPGTLVPLGRPNVNHRSEPPPARSRSRDRRGLPHHRTFQQSSRARSPAARQERRIPERPRSRSPLEPAIVQQPQSAPRQSMAMPARRAEHRRSRPPVRSTFATSSPNNIPILNRMTENSSSQVEQTRNAPAEPTGEPASVLLARRVRFAQPGQPLGQNLDELITMTMAAPEGQHET